MGSRWAWVGMVGLCALTVGCQERGEREAVAGPQVEAAATPGEASPVTVTQAGAGPVQPGTPAPPSGPQVNEPARGGTAAAAPAGTGAAAGGTAAAGTMAAGGTGTAAGGTPGAGTAQAPAREARVMIGSEAVQARDDEAWHEGAARAAQEAAPTGAPGSSLEEVVIASSSVNGRVTRVRRNAITVKDREGGVYELELDGRSRGVRQGRRVPLRKLEEGTPVRANFVLMGGRTVARDVQIRR